MKQTVYILCSLMIMTLTACEKGDGKSAQTIEFGEIAPQIVRDSSLQLQAKASSGLPVTFYSSNIRIAAINGNVVKFASAGKVYITAEQSGNESFYEAPNVTRELNIRDWDPNKKEQVITFELPEEWSNDYPPLQLVAVSTSGLPVKFTSNDWRAVVAQNLLILYHGTYTYNIYVDITASQEGDSIYNPADNVVRKLHVIGNGYH